MKSIAHKTALATALLLAGLANAQAAPVNVTVTVTNLATPNGISFAPLRLGFNNGSFDAFNNGASAGSAIVSVAEGGSGSAWFPAFSAADPGAILGTVGGALLSGASASATFTVDSILNRFFTFGSMVIPSNDLFIGNDSATAFQLFNADGSLRLTEIVQKGRDIWDAGSELADPANAAFVAGGVNANRTAQNGVVNFGTTELNAFNGVTTAAGYIFSTAGLSADADIYRIQFSSAPVPVPATLALTGLGLLGLGLVRRVKA